MTGPAVSVVIPTYGRDEVLVATVGQVVPLLGENDELLIVDQTPTHPPTVAGQLKQFEAQRGVRWLRLEKPSIPGAMNEGLQQASNSIVLYLDDDVVPDPGLIVGHRRAHSEQRAKIIAGQVLQPGQSAAPLSDMRFEFRSSIGQYVPELMAGNVSVQKEYAIAIGGFDENFVRVAYRFEAEFSDRVRAAGGRIWFEPQASLRHLRAQAGGTRSYGDHLRTADPGHAVGEYYYLLRARGRPGRWRELVSRPVRAVGTRHHLRRPWWIPVTLLGELRGFVWALRLARQGPKLMNNRDS